MAGIEELAGLARSEDPEMRGRVASALGTMGDAVALGLLVDMLSDPDRRVRIAAVRSIGDLRDRSGVEPLLPLLEEDDAELTCAVLASLAQIGDERTFAPIVTRLFDLNDDVRKNAAAATGVLRDPRALEPLLMCLDDPVEWVRANSAWALGGLDCPEAVGPLIELADSQDTETVRANAVSALGSIAARGRCGADEAGEAIELVFAVLDDMSEQTRVRVAAMISFAQGFERICTAFPQLGVRAFAIIEALASDSDDDIRSTSAWCLGRMCGQGAAARIGIADEVVEDVRAILTRLLDDPHDWCVRYAEESLSLL